MWGPEDHSGAKGNGAKSEWDKWEVRADRLLSVGKDLVIAPWIRVAMLTEQLPPLLLRQLCPTGRNRTSVWGHKPVRMEYYDATHVSHKLQQVASEP